MDTDQLTFISTAAAVGSASAALIGIFLLVVSLVTACQQSKREETRMVALLAERWERLRNEWHMALMRVHGPGAYYVEVELTDVEEYSRKLRRLEEAEDAMEGNLIDVDEYLAHQRDMLIDLGAHLGRETTMEEIFEIYDTGSDGWFNATFDRLVEEQFENTMERFRPLSQEYDRARAALSPYRVGTRNVLRFLGEASGEILRGLVRPESVYEAMGGEIARSGGSLRTLLGKTEVDWVSIQPGLALRILVLIDLMWAEGARLGEIATDISPQQAAITKKLQRTGKRNRKRAFDLAQRMGPRRNARRLKRLLKHAENPALTLTWDGPPNEPPSQQ